MASAKQAGCKLLRQEKALTVERAHPIAPPLLDKQAIRTERSQSILRGQSVVCAMAQCGKQPFSKLLRRTAYAGAAATRKAIDAAHSQTDAARPIKWSETCAYG
jgi:hypothetical protein